MTPVVSTLMEGFRPINILLSAVGGAILRKAGPALLEIGKDWARERAGKAVEDKLQGLHLHVPHLHHHKAEAPEAGEVRSLVHLPKPSCFSPAFDLREQV